jgi:hypothetical protein
LREVSEIVKKKNNGHLNFEFHIALQVAYFKPFVVTDGPDYQSWGLAIFVTLPGILIRKNPITLFSSSFPKLYTMNPNPVDMNPNSNSIILNPKDESGGTSLNANVMNSNSGSTILNQGAQHRQVIN